MGTTLATKQDLLLLATREDLLGTKQDLGSLKQELGMLKQDLAFLRQELSGVQRELKQEFENRVALLTHEIGTQTLKMTVRLGSMLFLGLGLTIAALRLWN